MTVDTMFSKNGGRKMKYDFVTAPNRSKTGSSKWEQMKDWNPNIPEGIIPFSVADMELKNAPEICQGLAKYATSESVFGYSQPTNSYLDSVCSWMKRRHNWDIKPEWIQVFAGVVPAFFTAVNAFTQPGEGVIIMTPVYYPFFMAMELSGRTIVRNQLIKTENSYDIDFQDLEEKAKDPNNKVLLFCSPHNPVGRVWRKEELEKVADICIRNDVLIITDEIHNDLIMPGYEHTVLATVLEEAANNMLICTAPSKTFNLAGLATSNIIIPNPKLKERFSKVSMQNGLFGVNCFGLRACEIAYTECEAWLDELNQLIYHNHLELKKYLSEHLPEVKVYDLQGTYLQWMDFNSLGMSNEELEKFMHMEALLFFDEGYVFGKEGSGFERMNIACPTKMMMDGLERLTKAIKKRNS
jgi:aminotransferase/cystathionine beta-lyase